MSIVAPVTVAWQRVTNGNTGEEKQIETFQQLEPAILRARDVILAAENPQNSDFEGNEPEAHITLHPGEFQFGNSLSQQELNNIYITVLPGAIITDSSSTFPVDSTENIADLNSFAARVFFAEQQQEFIFDSVVRFRDPVIFEENDFVNTVTGGQDIDVSPTAGDVVVRHGDTGGASGDNDTSTFLNQIEIDSTGHVETAVFSTQVVTSVVGGNDITTTRTNGEVTVNFDGQPGVDIEDNATSVLTSVPNINFGVGIDVTDDGDGTVTADVEEIQNNLNNLLPEGEDLSNLSSTEGEPANLSVASGTYSKNDFFSTSSNNERGAVGPTSVTVDGQLNPQVQSTDEYQSDTFQRASEGSLILILNGSDLLTIDLTSTDNAITETTGAGSELSVSAADPLTFPNGGDFEDTKQRTGTWTVVQGDMTPGVNEIRVRHEDGTGSLIGETQQIRYFLDDDTNDITFSNLGLSSLNTTGTKDLSGVTYHTGGSATYSADIDNVYRNVYSDSGSAITFNTTRSSVTSQSIPTLGATEDETTQINLSKTANISATRIIGNDIAVETVVEDPIDTGSPYTSNSVSNFDLLIDQASGSNSALLHNYIDESYRAAPSSDFDTDIGINSFDSTISLNDGGGAYDITSASFNQTFSISSEAGQDGFAVQFNDDGTKMYIGENGGTVYSYTLGTAYDISTATFANSFDVSSQTGFLQDIDFNNDGTKLYVGDSNNEIIYEYDLNTGFDLTTATYNSNFFDASGSVDLLGIRFDDDGDTLIVADDGATTVDEFSLSAPFDITTASSTGNTLDVSSEVSQPAGLDWNGDGTKLFVHDGGNNDVTEYTLSTAYDITTATASGNSFTLVDSGGSTLTASTDITFGDSGAKLYAPERLTENVFSYTMGPSGYDSELQVTEGQIVYPTVNYSPISDGPSGNPDYSTNVTGTRTYYGIFTDSTAVSNFILNIRGSATLVSSGNTSTNTDEASVSIKVPTQTGWMDVNEDFVSGNTSDGDGAYQETNADNPSQTIGPNSELGLTVGTKVTSDGFDKLYYRITVAEGWTGNITEMDIQWGV